ncbi:hypothetical protein M3Y99_00450600 [Aphelenchoides fujianensis]|nr:hypothetical protein M3Y99_00682400 [Aphelenchoides fujianensis]KAI6240556.1 hypothetical protein M3Y99_00450600 [Aphelenchoides fujianensis]
MVSSALYTVTLLIVAQAAFCQDDDREPSRLLFNDVPAPVDTYQRNSPALNQLFGQSVGQGWKYGQLAAKGVQSELTPKARNVLREVRKIVTKHTMNVRNQYNKLAPPTKKNLQSAAPLVKNVVDHYPTLKPVVDIVRKNLPSGFIATLTS